VLNPHDVPECRKVIKEEVERDEMSVIIAQAPCVLLPELKLRKPVSYYTNIDNCVGCTSCIRLGCPAISWTAFAKKARPKPGGTRKVRKATPGSTRCCATIVGSALRSVNSTPLPGESRNNE
jgi:indolepyruvate ferredoxin oxidoreductase alpha subunit